MKSTTLLPRLQFGLRDTGKYGERSTQQKAKQINNIYNGGYYDVWGAFSIPVSTPSPHSRGLSIYTDIKSVVMLASKVPLGKRQKGGGDGEENPERVDYGEHMPNDICRVVYWSVQNGPLVLLRRAGGCVWITSSSINSFFLKTRSRRGNNGWPSKELEENEKTNKADKRKWLKV